jgi:CheY-like chemotaxis protein
MTWPTTLLILGVLSLVVVAIIGGGAKVTSEGIELNSTGLLDHLRRAQEQRGKPQVDPDLSAIQAMKRDASERGVSKLPLGKVLWVDDHPLNNFWERLALANIGVMVDSYTANSDALVALKMSKYDVVVSDVGRDPGTETGFDLVRTIRQAGVAVPFLFYTGTLTSELRGKAEAAGATNIFDSPGPLIDAIVSTLTARD